MMTFVIFSCTQKLAGTLYQCLKLGCQNLLEIGTICQDFVLTIEAESWVLVVDQLYTLQITFLLYSLKIPPLQQQK